MQFYMAPMEGIGGYVYRNAYHKYFEPFDKYFLPFISPNPKGRLAPWELNDILPEHNIGMRVVPQILTNRAEDFIQTARQLQSMGYDEVNLNLGCPSKTVVAKGRGAGFLKEPDKLKCFLDEIFQKLSIKISLKTRIGFWDSDEFEALLNIYNQYPLEELIIHPRVQKDYYKNRPDWHAYEKAKIESHNPVCYNGDIFTKKDYQDWKTHFPEEQTLMIGRGILFFPGLLGSLKENLKYNRAVYHCFHDALLEGYLQSLHREENAIFKMKELWNFTLLSLENSGTFQMSMEVVQNMKRSKNLEEYEKAVEQIFLCI